jgi:CSLREA domain-containing protein
VVVGLLSPALALQAASLVVNSERDAPDLKPGDGVCEVELGRGECTLRAAIQEANAARVDSVVLPQGTYVLQVIGRDEDVAARGDLDITHSVSIAGADAANTIIDAVERDRIFHVLPGATLRLSGLTLQRGRTDASGGGGIFVESSAALNLREVVLSANQTAGAGGGILGGRNARIDIAASTVAYSQAKEGAGIFSSGPLTLSNSTLSFNSATQDGGGVAVDSGLMELANATLYSNRAMNGRGGGIATAAASFACATPSLPTVPRAVTAPVPSSPAVTT